MQVIDIINHGRNNELILTEKDIPSPGDDEILIDIKASGGNRQGEVGKYAKKRKS